MNPNDKRDEQDLNLSDDEFACLIMRACGVSKLQAALGADHGPCRFCSGILRAA